jgi:hypothetical protein
MNKSGQHWLVFNDCFARKVIPYDIPFIVIKCINLYGPNNFKCDLLNSTKSSFGFTILISGRVLVFVTANPQFPKSKKMVMKEKKVKTKKIAGKRIGENANISYVISVLFGNATLTST